MPTVTDLKDALVSNVEFSPIASCFFGLMDHLAAQPDRMAMGEPITDDELQHIFGVVMEGAFPDRKDFEMKLYEIKDSALVHGMGTVGGMCVVILFFREIDTGMAIAITNPRSSEMAYVRFQLSRLSSGAYEILSSGDPTMN
ncbi:MAG: hypothetical protein ACI8W8_000627 [Rhodothermales bacterium]|jgi:hypothetical protein